MALSDKIFERDVLAQGIGFPTVPKGQTRLRCMVSAAHTREHLDTAVGAIEDAGRDLGII